MPEISATMTPDVEVPQSVLQYVGEGVGLEDLYEALDIDPEEFGKRLSDDDPSAEDEIPLPGAVVTPESERHFASITGRKILALVAESVQGIDTDDRAVDWLAENHVLPPAVVQMIQDVRETVANGKRPDEIPRNTPTEIDLMSSFEYKHPSIRFEMQRRGISEATLRDLFVGFVPAKKTKPVGLKNRIVWQIRGVEPTSGGPEPVIYTHMGLATNQKQAMNDKWSRLKNCNVFLEIHNQDNMILHKESREQAERLGHYVLVPGLWDVAKLWECGIKNVGATFGNTLNQNQIKVRLNQITEMTGIKKFLLFFDRSEYGDQGNLISQEKAVERLQSMGFDADGFDWSRGFRQGGSMVHFPAHITSPRRFETATLRWFRDHRII